MRRGEWHGDRKNSRAPGLRRTSIGLGRVVVASGVGGGVGGGDGGEGGGCERLRCWLHRFLVYVFARSLDDGGSGSGGCGRTFALLVAIVLFLCLLLVARLFDPSRHLSFCVPPYFRLKWRCWLR